MAGFIRARPARQAVPPVERHAVGLAAAGLALTVLDVAGVAWPGWYVASNGQAGLHAAMGGAGALLLLVEGPGRVPAARGVGILLLALAAVGTLTPTFIGLGPRLGLAFEPLENAAHALLGAWGVWAARNE